MPVGDSPSAHSCPNQHRLACGGAPQDAGREDEYRFTVVKEVPDDAFGGTTLYARHDAYSDSQFCTVELTLERNASTGEPEVAINFADGETLCSGVVDLVARTIVGNVRQLEAGEEGTGEEGFEYPSDEVTHTFRLARVDADEASIDLQRRALRLESRCTDELFRLRGEDFRFASAEDIKRMPWMRMFDAAQSLGEQRFAELRYKAKRLQTVTFATKLDKRRLIDVELRPRGCKDDS